MQALPFIIGGAALVIGLGMLAMFARGVWIRRIVRERGVETMGVVRMTKKTREGRSMHITYTDRDGESHVKSYSMILAKEGTETTVRYDPEKPSRAVIELTKNMYFFWLVCGLVLAGWASVSLVLEVLPS